MVGRWKRLADKQGTSISKFVIEHVESSLRKEEGFKSGFKARAELLKRVQELEEENSGLKKEVRMLRLAMDKLEDELRGYRAKPFSAKKYRGMRGFERRLGVLLKTRKKIRGEEIFDLLGIDPRDREVTRAVYEQLKVLEAFGFVKAVADGWRWVK
jgi:hypothetical protein